MSMPKNSGLCGRSGDDATALAAVHGSGSDRMAPSQKPAVRQKAGSDQEPAVGSRPVSPTRRGQVGGLNLWPIQPPRDRSGVKFLDVQLGR